MFNSMKEEEGEQSLALHMKEMEEVEKEEESRKLGKIPTLSHLHRLVDAIAEKEVKEDGIFKSFITSIYAKNRAQMKDRWIYEQSYLKFLSNLIHASADKMGMAKMKQRRPCLSPTQPAAQLGEGGGKEDLHGGEKDGKESESVSGMVPEWNWVDAYTSMCESFAPARQRSPPPILKLGMTNMAEMGLAQDMFEYVTTVVNSMSEGMGDDAGEEGVRRGVAKSQMIESLLIEVCTYVTVQVLARIDVKVTEGGVGDELGNGIERVLSSSVTAANYLLDSILSGVFVAEKKKHLYAKNLKFQQSRAAKLQSEASGGGEEAENHGKQGEARRDGQQEDPGVVRSDGSRHSPRHCDGVDNGNRVGMSTSPLPSPVLHIQAVSCNYQINSFVRSLLLPGSFQPLRMRVVDILSSVCALITSEEGNAKLMQVQEGLPVPHIKQPTTREEQERRALSVVSSYTSNVAKLLFCMRSVLAMPDITRHTLNFRVVFGLLSDLLSLTPAASRLFLIMPKAAEDLVKVLTHTYTNVSGYTDTSVDLTALAECMLTIGVAIDHHEKVPTSLSDDELNQASLQGSPDLVHKEFGFNPSFHLVRSAIVEWFWVNKRCRVEELCSTYLPSGMEKLSKYMRNRIAGKVCLLYKRMTSHASNDVFAVKVTNFCLYTTQALAEAKGAGSYLLAHGLFGILTADVTVLIKEKKIPGLSKLIQSTLDELKSYERRQGSWYKRCGYYGAKVFAAGVKLNTEIGNVFRRVLAQHEPGFFADVIDTGLARSVADSSSFSTNMDAALLSSKYDLEEGEGVASNLFGKACTSIERTPSALNLLEVAISWKDGVKSSANVEEDSGEKEKDEDVKSGGAVFSQPRNAGEAGQKPYKEFIKNFSDVNTNVNLSNFDHPIGPTNKVHPEKEKENDLSGWSMVEPEQQEVPNVARRRSPLPEGVPTVPLPPSLSEWEQESISTSVKDAEVMHVEEDEVFDEAEDRSTSFLC
uniref:Uncharacterized protein n=1 Tax=Palpitomonas bilix TaxID=652834 RepID=A0A7S3GJP4_9EUKA